MVHIKKKKSVESALWAHVTQCQVPTGMQVLEERTPLLSLGKCLVKGWPIPEVQ